jgi:hypothetical protein
MPVPVTAQQLMEAIHELEVFLITQHDLNGYRVGFSVLPETLAMSVTIPSTATVETIQRIVQHAERGVVPIRFRTEVELTPEQTIKYLEGRAVAMPFRTS